MSVLCRLPEDVERIIWKQVYNGCVPHVKDGYYNYLLKRAKQAYNDKNQAIIEHNAVYGAICEKVIHRLQGDKERYIGDFYDVRHKDITNNIKPLERIWWKQRQHLMEYVAEMKPSYDYFDEEMLKIRDEDEIKEPCIDVRHLWEYNKNGEVSR